MDNEKKYRIYDKIAKVWLSYLKGMFSSDCWTCISRCANVYTLHDAKKERDWIAKVCHVKRNDLVIELINA